MLEDLSLSINFNAFKIISMNTWLIKLICCASFVVFLVGAYLRMIDANSANSYLNTGVITGFLCLAFALFEIFSSKTIKTVEKLMWVVGFFTTGWAALLIYAFMGRNEVDSNTEVNNIRTT